jgi:hypothetical protein
VLKKSGLLIGLLCSACWAFSQDPRADSVLLANDPLIAEFDSLLANSEDSLSLFRMLDGLINATTPKRTSQLLFRVGYNSNVNSTNQVAGLNQFGLSPGVSFYHRSGLYADASGYWSNQYTPNYYLTVLSLGYLGLPNSWWSLSTEYNRFLYNQSGEDIYTPYTNNLAFSNFFDVKKLTFRLDYQFYFGDKQAHRIAPGVMLNFEFKNVGKISRINVRPFFNVLFGSEQIVNEYWEPYTTRPLEILFRVRNNLPLYYFVSEKSTEFGVLNYALSLPLTLSLRDWNFQFSYTYNIPKTLSSEVIQLSNGGYVALGVTRKITFR